MISLLFFLAVIRFKKRIIEIFFRARSILSKRTSEKLANALPQMIWVADPQGKITYYNDLCDRFLGNSRKKTHFDDWENVVHPSEIENFRQSWRNAVDACFTYYAEFRLFDQEKGEYRWFARKASPVKNRRGRVELWFGVFVDIHQQKIEQQSLLQAMKELSDVKFSLDQSSILAVTNVKGVITHVNDKFCEISKYERHELIGQTHQLINSDYHPAEFFVDLWKTISSGNVWRGEIQNKAKDGSLYWVDTVIVPFLDADKKPYQYTAIRTDITQKKKNEQERAQLIAREQIALEGSRLKSEFLANMSHEIRTPLNAVLGMTDVLMTTELSSEQQEYAQVIKESTKTLMSLVNDILDFSKIESGKLEIEKIKFDLRSLLVQIANEFHMCAREKGISFYIENPSVIPTNVMGDPVRIRQVVTNLISNGMKFTERGLVVLRFHPLLSEDGKLKFKIEVEDSGCGIEEGKISKLFLPFVQSDSSTTRRYGGTGLGLSICKNLIELMGGEIGVESMLGSGSCFWFELELETALEYEAKIPKPQDERQQKETLGGEARLLLVEDIVINQKVTSLLFSSFGFSTDIASNGEEALKMMAAKEYDLVFMDCHMPVMDGFVATKKIRENPNLNQNGVPIIALTASAMVGDREKCLQVGMSDYLLKPFSREDLKRCLMRWLKCETIQEQVVVSQSRRKTKQQSGSIDWSKVDNLARLNAGSGADIVLDMLELFKKNVPLRLREIEKAIASRDSLVLAREAHALKSSTCYLGAVNIGKLCDIISIHAKSNSFENSRTVYCMLQDEYQDTLAQLKMSQGVC